MANKTIFVRHLNQSFVLVPREQLRFKAHGRQFGVPDYLWGLRAALPAPPASFDLSGGEKLVYPILGNNRYGCCYYAAAAHGSQNFTGNSGSECSFDEQQLTRRYLQLSGGDNGLDDSLILPEWEGGIVGPGGPRKILDTLTVDPADNAATQAAMFFGCGLIWTCSLLDSWLSATDPGTVWDAGGRPDPSAGHAMFLTGFRANKNVDTRTWGISPPIQVTPAGMKAADSELLVIASLDQFDAQGYHHPTGLHYTAWAPLWQQLGGKPLPPSPFPAPGPTPPPAPPGPAWTVQGKILGLIPFSGTATLTPARAAAAGAVDWLALARDVFAAVSRDVMANQPVGQIALDVEAVLLKYFGLAEGAIPWGTLWRIALAIVQAVLPLLLPRSGAAAPPATPDELVQTTLANITGVITAGPIVQAVVGAEGLKELFAQRDYWTGACAPERAAYFATYQRQP